MRIKQYNSVRYMQEGGPIPADPSMDPAMAEGAPMEPGMEGAPAGPEAGGQDQMMQQVAQMAQEIISQMGPEVAMMLAQIIMEMLQGGAGAPAGGPAPEGEPIFKCGGKLAGRKKKVKKAEEGDKIVKKKNKDVRSRAEEAGYSRRDYRRAKQNLRNAGMSRQESFDAIDKMSDRVALEKKKQADGIYDSMPSGPSFGGGASTTSSAGLDMRGAPKAGRPNLMDLNFDHMSYGDAFRAANSIARGGDVRKMSDVALLSYTPKETFKWRGGTYGLNYSYWGWFDPKKENPFPDRDPRSRSDVMKSYYDELDKAVADPEYKKDKYYSTLPHDFDVVGKSVNENQEGQSGATKTTPVDSTARTTPVDSAGIRVPVDSAGIRVPVDSAGIRVPVDSAGIRVPVDSAGIRVPVDSAKRTDLLKWLDRISKTQTDSSIINKPDTNVVVRIHQDSSGKKNLFGFEDIITTKPSTDSVTRKSSQVDSAMRKSPTDSTIKKETAKTTTDSLIRKSSADSSSVAKK